MNKPCYNDSLCLHECTKMIGLKRKRQFFEAKKLKWFLLFSGIIFQESVSKQNLYACARAKKAMSLRHSAYIPSSVKSRVGASSFFNFIKKRVQRRCFTVAKFLRTPILKNICVRLLLNWLLKVIVWNFVSGQSLSKPSWLGNITKIPVAFQSEL